MVDHAPRDMAQWMRSIERRLDAARRGAERIPFTYNEKLRGDILADKLRHPAAPVEVTYQTSLYTEDGLAKQQARIDVDFPDVTKATDGSDIPIMEYELWGRDDTTNYLEATTSAVAGLAAPGLTFPGLANTDAMKAKAAKALAPFRRLATSQLSSLRALKFKPGSVWTFKVRAIGRYTVDPGEFSAEFQAQMIADVIPPPQPTVPKLVVSHGTISIEWDGLSVNGAMPGDFSHLVVAWGPSAAPIAEGTRFHRRGLWVVSDLDYYTPLHVRFQAVDYSGNVSPWSEESVAFTKPLVDTDVILSEIDGDKTTIKNIGEEAIKDGAVLAGKLADNAVSLEKLDESVQEAVAAGLSAFQQAGDTGRDIVRLQGSVDGKTTIRNETTDAGPGVPGVTAGDRWQKWDTLAAGGKLLKSWRWSGAVWIPELMDPTYLPLVDIGQGTFGSLNGSRIEADSITADKVLIGVGANLFADPEIQDIANWSGGFASKTDGKTGKGSILLPTSASQTGSYYGMPGAAETPAKFGMRLVPGSTYRVSAWVRSDVDIPANQVKVYVRLYDGAATNFTFTADVTGSIPQNSAVIPANTWTLVSGMTKVPDGTTSIYGVLGLYKQATFTTGAVRWSDPVVQQATAGELLVDGTVTANKVNAQSVAGAVGQFIQLNVSQLNATTAAMSQAVIDKLWADVVTSRKITTGMLAVADLTDFAPSYRDSPTDWTMDGGMECLTTGIAGAYDGYRFTSRATTGNSPAQRAMGPKIAVLPGDELYAEGVLYRAASTSDPMYLRYYFYNKDGGYVTSGGTKLDGTAQDNLLPNNALHQIKATVPSTGVMYAQVVVTILNSTGTDLGIYNVRGMRRSGGKLIVDGSITTDQLGAQSVTAGKIKALDITAGQIAANAIEADKIKAGAVTAAKLEAQLVLATKIVAGTPSGIHAEMDTNGFKVYGVNDAGTYETVRLGVAGTDDLFAISDENGVPTIQGSPDGSFSVLSLEAADSIYYKGVELKDYVDTRPRGMAAWGQVPVGSNMSVGSGNEVGLFELAWDGGDTPSRMYEFVLNEFLVNCSSAGTVGLRLHLSTDGTPPTISDPIIQYNYDRISDPGYSGLGLSRIIGSNNGNYMRVLVGLYWTGAAGSNATVYSGNNYLYSRIMDLGETIDPTAVATTGGGTPFSGSTVSSPTTAKVTKTVEYGYTSVKSYLPSGSQYNYNTSKAYQGPSPAGYGNLQAQYGFNQNFQSLLSGATINGIWVYLYYEHWYYNAGGTAMIRLHNNLQAPATNVGMTSNGVNSGSWPKGAGRWVALPSSLWAGFASGTYKGFGIVGDGTYNTYGYANNARIRIKYTK